MLKAALKLVWLLALPSPLLASAETLRLQAAEFAGQPVWLDERLQIPPCPEDYALRWGNSRRTVVSAGCAAIGWRISLPIRQEAVARRGELLRVETGGAGFRLGVDAVVESGSGERLTVRNSRSGRRFGAIAAGEGKAIFGGDAESR